MDDRYKSEINRGVAPARPGEFEPIPIGPLRIWPPVVLAPMAGITNSPFRKICRQYGAGLYVSEMITARALVEQNAKTLRLAGFEPDESPRSLQLYGVDPMYMAKAVEWLCGEGLVDHIDMNFGCPVRKVTRRGGGAALPGKPRLLARIVRAAVEAAGPVPVTMKFRIGIDDDWHTFRDTGRIGEQEGCAAIALHARTAAQLYDGEADWDAIAELKQRVTSIPVLGNGDIWEAGDALRMMRHTGCDGVVVGRGCLGRPWLFGDLAAVFDGREPPDPPRFGEVARTMLSHARLLSEWMGERLGVRFHSLPLHHRGQGFDEGVSGDCSKVESLTARQNRHRHFANFRGGENKLDVLGRLFQRFEQRIERFSCEHVHFIDYINLVRALGGSVANILPQLSNFVDTPVRGAVDF